MSWEVRGARRYYTRTHKVEGRYRREYLGGGTRGELAALADALRRANRRAASEARKAERTRLDVATKPLQELARLCDLLAHAALAAGGYHKHGGEWRRAMTATTQTTTPAAGAAGENPPVADPMQQVLLRARQGDRSVLPELTKYLDAHPNFWRSCGDLAAHAQASWIDRAAGHDLLFQHSLRRKADELRVELAGPDAPPLEKLLATRVVATWLQLQYCDAAYAQAKEMSPVLDAAAQKRQNTAQTRYLAAIKQLAVVRKLLKPAPSPLDLLKFPVNEGDVGTRPGQRRTGMATQPVAN